MSNEDDAKKVQEAHELLNRAMILLSPQAPQPSLPRSSNQTFPTNTSNSSNQDAESNFFSCFPAARGTPNPLRRKPKGSRTQPYFIPPSTWTHDFFLLASKHAEKSPDRLTVLELNNAGLGKKKVVFQDKKGDHSHIRKTLESHYPMLRSQNGAFSLLRCESGGSGVRGLKQIGPSNAGYTVPLLKDVCKSSLIYIKPLNTSIDIISIDQPTTVTEEDNEYAKAVCNICKIDIPLTLFEEHQNICSSKENTERIDEAAPDPDFPNLNQRLEQLKVLFPKGNERNVARAAFDSITTDQAVEKYLQLNEIEEKKSGSEAASGSRNEIEETNFERFDDMLDHYRNKYLTEEKTCSLNVQREELWRVAQAFYKKAINDPEILFRKFEVNFSKDTGEEESVDAGALKIEFFELLLVELKNRCLEGDEFSLIPRKSDSVNFIILGLAIAHSVLHGGPGFYQFQAWVYQILVGNDDPENLMTFIDKKLIVKSASSVNLLKFIDQLQAANTKSELDEVVDKFIEIINCSRWESSTEITLKNKGVLLAQLVYDELIYRRQTPIQSIREGLKITGLLPVMIRNQQLCEPIFSYNAKIDAPTLKAILVNNDVNKDDFEKQQAFNFFNKLLDDDEMPPQFLKAVLKFSTGFHNIPPWGMKKKIMIRYLADDESKIYPESMSCFNIFYLPTVHSDFQKFKNDMLKAFEIEGIGFSSSS